MSNLAACTSGNLHLRDALFDLLCRCEIGSSELDAELVRLERLNAAALYSELIHVLCHLRIDNDEARRHWQQICAHRRSMEERLGSTVHPRVALLDYFVAVNRKLTNPMIIEMRLFEETRSATLKDGLTGLYNYRFFGEHLKREISRCRRGHAPLSLLVIDVDDFKVYNDRNGHATGNNALAAVGRLLQASLRDGDVAARYGGEEFTLILPATPKAGALNVAEKVQSMIAKHSFPHEDEQSGGALSVSVGVATFPADGEDADELLRCADAAMYLAKANGKNQVNLYGDSSRSYHRIDAAVPGRLRVLAVDSAPLTTVTISDGGLLFVSENCLAPGSSIEIDLELPGVDHELTILGRVIKTEEKPDGTFETAVSLKDSTAGDRTLLAQYLHRQRQESEPVPTA